MKLQLFLAIQMVVIVENGLGAIDFVDPPNGSVIADFEGAENITTIMCNVTDARFSPPIQLTTRWSIQDFRGVLDLQTITDDFDTNLFLIHGDSDTIGSLRNQLTILRLTSELDGATVYCGSGAFPREAIFLLRIYRAPILQDDLMFRTVENSLNVPFDLSLAPAAFPEPTSYIWTRNGIQLSGPPPVLSYSTITFPSISRSDAGSYVLSATNFVLRNDLVPIGSDTGSFSLDVIYAPTFAEPGPLQHYALLNERLSLVCGAGLDSNPHANISWTAPDETTIVDNARYDLENGPDIVRLNFTHTILSDTGIWRCDIRVVSAQDIVSNGSLVPKDLSVIGSPIVRNIHLTIIVIPGSPQTLAVESIGATSVQLCWEPPLVADSPITFYTISALNLNTTGEMNDIVLRNTTTNSTFFNMTSLLPGITYELTVMAVSHGGDIFAVSQASDSLQITTIVTVPALSCDTPTSVNGDITVTWSYTHTGGLPLTNVFVTYIFNEETTTNPVSVSDIDTGTTSIEVPNLVAGFEYTFNITAVNSNGPSNILCGPVLHRVGRPAPPMFGELISGPGDGEVTVMIKTVASGLEDPLQVFWFVITPYTDSSEGETVPHLIPNYQSGTFATIIVGGLEQDARYRFNATAANMLGASGVATSNFVTAGVGSTSNIGGIIGGVVGGLSVLIILTMLTILLMAVALRLLKRKGKLVITEEVTEPQYEVPDFPQQTPGKDQGIELTECPAYGIVPT